MLVLRSLIFTAYVPLWTAFISTAGLPLFFFVPRYVWLVAYAWGHGVLFGARVICNITHEMRGKEHLPSAPFIIASKHQSAWDTAVFLTIFPRVSYIFKKELLWIPLFGQYLLRLGMIPIDRKGGGKTLKGMILAVKKRLAEGRSIVIYPEGTRVNTGADMPYQAGIAAMYSQVREAAPILPVALNSGMFWSRDGFLKYPGKIVVEYLPVMESNLEKRELLAQLKSRIDSATRALEAEASAHAAKKIASH